MSATDRPSEAEVERIARAYFARECGGTPEEHAKGEDGWATEDWLDSMRDTVRFVLAYGKEGARE